MKYINFKRFKFSTILKYINFQRYNFSKIFKYFDLYNFSKIFNYFDLYNFSKISKYFDLKRYSFFKFYRYFNFKRFYFPKINKYFNYKTYNFSKIYRQINFNKFRNVPFYFFGLIFFSFFVYLSIPIFFNYNKSNIENVICEGINIKCSIKGKINYSFFPSPRLKLKDIKINDFKNKIIGEVKEIEIKISLFNLINKNQFKFKKINVANGKFNFDLKDSEKYKNFFRKKFNSLPVNLTKSEINFIEGKKHITNIQNVKIKYKSKKSKDEIILKGKFLGDDLYINLISKKFDKKLSKIIVFKMTDSKLYTKINIYKSPKNKKNVNGDALFKKGKNKLLGIFNYKNDQIIIEQANLQNVYLDGKFEGEINFLPYFDFNLDLNLNSINFNRIYTYLINLDKDQREDLFLVNEKINGKVNLFINKIYSKYNFIDSVESRIKFFNGNVSVEQMLLNFGKLGAADLEGFIKKDPKFNSLKFENNIFIDNQKYFFRKFGIYNRENVPSNLFISGSFNLKDLDLHLNEISANQKLKDEDVLYIENEFNDLLLGEGYSSLFNFLKLKEFVRTINNENF